MIIEFKTGQRSPVVIGRDNHKRKDFECTLDGHYNDRTESVTERVQSCLPVEMLGIINAMKLRLVEAHGEPVFFRFKGVSK